MLGLIILFAIWSVLLLAFVPAEKILKAQVWVKLQIEKIKAKLDK